MRAAWIAGGFATTTAKTIHGYRSCMLKIKHNIKRIYKVIPYNILLYEQIKKFIREIFKYEDSRKSFL